MTGVAPGPIFQIVDITFDVVGAVGDSTAVTPDIGLVGWFNLSGPLGGIPVDVRVVDRERSACSGFGLAVRFCSRTAQLDTASELSKNIAIKLNL